MLKLSQTPRQRRDSFSPQRYADKLPLRFRVPASYRPQTNGALHQDSLPHGPQGTAWPMPQGQAGAPLPTACLGAILKPHSNQVAWFYTKIQSKIHVHCNCNPLLCNLSQDHSTTAKRKESCFRVHELSYSFSPIHWRRKRLQVSNFDMKFWVIL